MNNNENNIISLLENVGRESGYGHSMWILSALWANKLKNEGLPIDGVFIPTCLPFIKFSKLQEEDKHTLEVYMKMVGQVVNN